MSKLNTGTYHVSEGAPARRLELRQRLVRRRRNYVQKSGANLTIALPLVGKVECTYMNKRDTGSLTLSKVLTGGPAGYTGPFTINYDCNDGTAHDGSKSVYCWFDVVGDHGYSDGDAVHDLGDASDCADGLHVRGAVVLAVCDGDDHDQGSDGQRADHATR